MWSEQIFKTLAEKNESARIGGGEARIRKQHEAHKLTARERIDLLLDKGSFQEINMLSEGRELDIKTGKKHYPGDGVVAGYGNIEGRLVFVISQDFTVNGGSGGEEYVRKICCVLEKAIDNKAPFISLNDSGGARIEDGICSLAAYSRLFHLNTMASGYIPQIAVIMGNCAGGASYSPVLCDLLFMVKGTSQMYITGPQVIKAVTGNDISMEQLGGTWLHSEVNGQAHIVFDNDRECLAQVRKILMYLPSNCKEKPPVINGEPIDRTDTIQDLVPENKRKPFDVKPVILTMVDKGSFIELQEKYAENMVVGLARIDGNAVGFVANQPRVLGGAIDCHAADKAARFVRFCDCFNVPIITLVDVPAFLPGVDSEKAGIIKHGGRLLYAFSEATVPKISIVMRKAYGGAYSAMNSKTLSADIVYAWPICEIAVMGAEGAVNVLYRREIAEAEDPDAKRRELISQYERDYLNPYYAASRGFVDEVIKPEDTKKKIVSALIMLKGKQQQRHPDKKHGNIPL